MDTRHPLRWFLVLAALGLLGCETKTETVPAPIPHAVSHTPHPKGRAVDIAFTDVQPVPRFQARPQYPVAFRKAGIDGEALVDFIVDESGASTQVDFVRATDFAFARAAMVAVSQWRFVPARKDGVVVACHMQVPIIFTVRESTGRPPPKAAVRTVGGRVRPQDTES